MLDASLKRLQVDHVDIIQIHQLGDHALGGQADTGLNRLDNPALYEAIEAAKKAGKARFAGATSHVNNRLEILSKAINSGHFDMILVKYNFSEYDSASIPALLKLCKDKNIGVVAMKAQQNNQQVAKLAGQMPDIWQANLLQRLYSH